MYSKVYWHSVPVNLISLQWHFNLYCVNRIKTTSTCMFIMHALHICRSIFRSIRTPPFTICDLNLCNTSLRPSWIHPDNDIVLVFWKLHTVHDYTHTQCTLVSTWSMPIGNSGVGAVVSQSLKSGWGLVSCSRAFSNSFSQRMSRWQFCSMSQWPLVEAVSNSCRATCAVVTLCYHPKHTHTLFCCTTSKVHHV